MKRVFKSCFATGAFGLTLGAWAGSPETATPSPDSAELLKHIKVLASEEFEGRSPGTHGEEVTIAYLTEQFKALGLAGQS